MKQITVTGMSCQHCANAVHSALTQLGLTDVQVDLAAGRATFSPNAAVAEQAVREAIDDVGFAVTEIA